MEVNWNQVVGDLLTQMLRILLPVALMLFLKWAAEFWRQIHAKNPKLAELLERAGAVGYAAAEEYFRGGYGSTPSEKMEYALRHANEYLKTLGLHVDLNVIRDAIVQYGVANYKFSWTKAPLFEFAESLKPESESEEEKEDDQ